MLLKDFKEKVEVLPLDEANILRELYIDNFIDKSKEGYKNNISVRKLFPDGYCYTGYLWDYLKKYQRITFQSLINELSNKKSVLVLWDIHSSNRIITNDYWKFGKDSVVRIDTKYLIEGIDNFPEDIYIFDDDFLWTYIITHEDDGKRRICLKV